mgnify:CR=1 FL=1
MADYLSSFSSPNDITEMEYRDSALQDLLQTWLNFPSASDSSCYSAVLGKANCRVFSCFPSPIMHLRLEMWATWTAFATRRMAKHEINLLSKRTRGRTAPHQLQGTRLSIDDQAIDTINHTASLYLTQQWYAIHLFYTIRLTVL